ncbi:MAG: hypothetical protein ACK46X_12050 [Candidatus Sericytochromatia bacterium]
MKKPWMTALAVLGALALTGCPGSEQVTEDPPGIHDLSPSPSPTAK